MYSALPCSSPFTGPCVCVLQSKGFDGEKVYVTVPAHVKRNSRRHQYMTSLSVLDTFRFLEHKRFRDRFALFAFRIVFFSHYHPYLSLGFFVALVVVLLRGLARR
jgi:hypothetical protein